jgi:glycerol kinase
MITILAIDQGTTSTKAYRSGADLAFVPVGRRTHRQIHPHPGWMEHDPAELVENIRALIEQGGGCDTLGLANQGETVLAWDAVTKRPLYNAIVWQDERTKTAVERLRAAGVEALTRERAGLPLDSYFSASKLRWLLDHAEGAKELARRGRLRLGTSDAFFLDVLAGTFATDVSTASRTSLLDIRTLRWDAELCRAFGVPPECLPEIRPTVGDFGELRGPPRARVVASAVDQQAALFGHGCRVRGDIKITFGTGAFALGLTGEAPLLEARSGLLPTCAWRIGAALPAYALDGGLFTAGAALEWLRQVGLLHGFAETEHFDGPSAATRGLMFVPAQAGLGCPYWDHSARGLWLGLDLATSRADLCRAVLEGVALRAAQVLRAMIRATGGARRISVDGGLSQSTDFVQFLADAIGTDIAVATAADVTAYGLVQLCRAADGKVPPDAPDFAWRRIAPAAPLPEALHARFAEAVARARGWAAAPVLEDETGR